MTSEEWIANIPSEQDRKYAREAVIAALEREREGEVVFAKGKIEVTDDSLWVGDNDVIDWFNDNDGKSGSLIFRPDTKGEK